MGRIVRELYGDTEPPREVLVSLMPDEADLITEWLTEIGERNVSLRVPQRGAKRRLMETASMNAAEAFARHRLSRQKDHNARAKAMRSLQEVLGLPDPPLRIEAYDISTLQGTNTVASMVVLEDGMPRRNDYRHFKIRTVEGQDDFASMEETIRRRFTAYLAEKNKPVAEQGRFSYPPSLVLIDGGRRSAGPGGQGARRALAGHPRHRSGQEDGGGLSARQSPSRSSSRATPRPSISSSRFVTRPIASPSPTTASSARSRWSTPSSTRSRGSARNENAT